MPFKEAHMSGASEIPFSIPGDTSPPAGLSAERILNEIQQRLNKKGIVCHRVEDRDSLVWYPVTKRMCAENDTLDGQPLTSYEKCMSIGLTINVSIFPGMIDVFPPTYSLNISEVVSCDSEEAMNRLPAHALLIKWIKSYFLRHTSLSFGDGSSLQLSVKASYESEDVDENVLLRADVDVRWNRVIFRSKKEITPYVDEIETLVLVGQLFRNAADALHDCSASPE
jgi:hypothetical protein